MTHLRNWMSQWMFEIARDNKEPEKQEEVKEQEEPKQDTEQKERNG